MSAETRPEGVPRVRLARSAKSLWHPRAGDRAPLHESGQGDVQYGGGCSAMRPSLLRRKSAVQIRVWPPGQHVPR